MPYLIVAFSFIQLRFLLRITLGTFELRFFTVVLFSSLLYFFLILPASFFLGSLITSLRVYRRVSEFTKGEELSSLDQLPFYLIKILKDETRAKERLIRNLSLLSQEVSPFLREGVSIYVYQEEGKEVLNMTIRSDNALTREKLVKKVGEQVERTGRFIDTGNLHNNLGLVPINFLMLISCFINLALVEGVSLIINDYFTNFPKKIT